MRSTGRPDQHCTSSSRMAFGNGASRVTDLAELARRSSHTAIRGFVQNRKLAPAANECARGLVFATYANVLEGEGHAYRREAPARIGRQVARTWCGNDGTCDGVQSDALGSNALRSRWCTCSGRKLFDRLLPAR